MGLNVSEKGQINITVELENSFSKLSIPDYTIIRRIIAMFKQYRCSAQGKNKDNYNPSNLFARARLV